MNFKILEELKVLIPPLSEEEFKQLESNCLNEGIREPLVLAQFPNKFSEVQTVLADGHNRYDIAQRNGLEFKTVVKDFSSFEEVKLWMDLNQIGRRNLHPKYFKQILGRIYNARKKQSSGRADRSFGVAKNATPKTHQQIAAQYGVGERTVVSAGNQQEIVQKIAKAEGRNEFEVLDELGKDKVIQKIAREAKKSDVNVVELKNKVLAEQAEKVKAKTQKREKIKEQLKTLSLLDFVGNKKYRVIYADPPWQYGDSLNIEGYGIGTDDHYITMPLEAICKMPVKDITDPNAVLFLWVTSPFLEDAFKVINSWGFKYKSSFVWNKLAHVMGHYNSVRHEFLLIATKGSCTPDKKKLFPSVQDIQRNSVHSNKPGYFVEIIDTLYNWGNKLEIFGREERKKWDVFGNQNIKDDRVLQK